MLIFEQPLLLLLIIPISILVYLTWKRMSLPFPVPQRRLILAARLALFALIVLALAGTAWNSPASHQATVFVGDISDSTGTQRAFIEQWINNAIKDKRPDDQVGIVALGRNALVEQSVKAQLDFSKFESTPDTQYTDISAGLRLASAIMPGDAERHIVLLTDGQQNLGDAIQEAQLLQQQGIRLDIIPLPTIRTAEASVVGLDAPTELRTNEHFTLHVKLNSTVAQKATLRVYLDTTLLSQQSISLSVGQQDVSYDLLAPAVGFHTFRVTLDAPNDTIAQNNEASTFVNVQGPPQVLIIEGQPGDGKNIATALAATKIDVKIGTPGDVPTTLDGLVQYSAVVLADVPAAALGSTRMQILQSFVRDLGHGLVVSGGQNSYGVGGYAGTPLEQTLPVRMDIPQHKETPSIAVILIIESLEAPLPVNISKEAAKGVVGLLTPRDQVGISAGYGTLSIKLQYVTDKASIDKSIDTMMPEDPPSYNPDLANAEQVLLHTNAKIKHVILLGDGDAFDNYAPQVTKMAGENITVSAVETNASSPEEVATMQQIAQWGKGRFYRAEDVSTIPRVLLTETEQASRRSIINESFTPAEVGAHPIMTNINALPSLDGYVATTPKPTGQVVLASNHDDPVLAVWQYGLGRVAAWTSDALGLWTKQWLSWNDGARWWANLITWTLPSPDSAMNINGKIVNGSGQLTVDLPAGTSAAAGGQQQAQASIIIPNDPNQPAGASNTASETINLQPTAADRWEGSFPAPRVGAYLIKVTWKASASNTQQGNQLTATTGLVVPYSPEYSTQGTNLPFLRQLAQAGGGNVLSSDFNNIDVVYNQQLAPVSSAIPLAFLLLALAALLLPIDIAARRLSSLEFLTQGYQWLLKRLNPRATRLASASAEAEAPPTVAPLGQLRTSREKMRTRGTQVKKAAEELRKAQKVQAPASKAQADDKPVPPKEQKVPAKEQPAEPTVGTSSRLLEAKRKRNNKA